MRIFYHHEKRGNFGDDLNAWLWQELLPGRWADDDGILFSGIGSIIGHSLPPATKVVIFSSGAGYYPVPSGLGGADWEIAAVRGPLSARVLGLPVEAAIADGGVLLSTLPRLAPLPDAGRAGIVFVPHHASLADAAWFQAARLAGIELLDPRGPSEAVVQRLRSARLVLAESLHAAIVADALRVPWIPVTSNDHINSFKWLDWALSLSVPYEPVALAAPSSLTRYLSWSQRFCHGAYRVDPPDIEAVLEHFRRHMTIKAQAIQRHRRRHGRVRFVMQAIPQRVARMPVVATVKASIDRGQVERAAAALAALSAHRGYLSDPAILTARVQALRHCLDRYR